MSDIINDLKTQGESKIHLTMVINFSSSKDSEENRIMYNPTNNIEVMIVMDTDKTTEDLFDYFLQRYQKGLEESMRGSKFDFDNVDSFYYKLHKKSLYRGRSYIDSLKWLKNRKATINRKSNEDKCF